MNTPAPQLGVTKTLLNSPSVQKTYERILTGESLPLPPIQGRRQKGKGFGSVLKSIASGVGRVAKSGAFKQALRFGNSLVNPEDDRPTRQYSYDRKPRSRQRRQKRQPRQIKTSALPADAVESVSAALANALSKNDGGGKSRYRKTKRQNSIIRPQAGKGFRRSRGPIRI